MNAFIEKVRAKLPKESNGKSSKSKKKSKTPSVVSTTPGVIYVGHLPHGFFENELRKYFQQFGTVLRLRVARSRKTGGCKGFAFIEFECQEVAKVAAEAMNNYMFFEKILKCEFIPPEKVHRYTFKGWKKSMPYSSLINKRKQNKEKTEEVVKRAKSKRIAKLKKLKSVLNEKGINFKFDIKETK